jgi:hypothetical protein
MAAAVHPSRSLLAVIAAVSVVSGAAFVIVTWPFTWTSDITRNLAAARALLDGRFGTVEGYLYSPLAAALTVPLLAIPTFAAVLAWLGVKLAILIGSAATASRMLATRERILIAAAVVAFLPVVHDLLLGNVTVVIAAAIAYVAWNPDRARTGLPIGIVLATVPKPVLVPVLIWMLLWRRRAGMSALVVAAIATAAMVLLIGSDAAGAWIAALRNPPILSGGNFALSSWPPIPAILGATATIAATAIALRRGEGPGLVAVLCCGLLVSNYTVLYGAGVLLAAVPVVARAAPRATAVLALVAPVGLIAGFAIWVGAVIAVALAVPVQRWPNAASGTTLDATRRPLASPPRGEVAARS